MSGNDLTNTAQEQNGFIHLHVHTQYSLLQGAIHVEDLLAKVAEEGMPAVAITDTNNLFGAIDFYTQAKAKGVKPIIGCDVWYLEQGYVGAQQAAVAAAASAAAQDEALHLAAGRLGQGGHEVDQPRVGVGGQIGRAHV